MKRIVWVGLLSLGSSTLASILGPTESIDIPFSFPLVVRQDKVILNVGDFPDTLELLPTGMGARVTATVTGQVDGNEVEVSSFLSFGYSPGSRTSFEAREYDPMIMTAVPEPSAALLVSSSIAFLLVRRKRR